MGQQQPGAAMRRQQQQPAPHGPPSHAPGPDQQQQPHAPQPPTPPLRVARSPLKRRSTGLPCRGLSRNYAGRSQSFDCIQELARNPWGGESALALAKRRALPLAVPAGPPGGRGGAGGAGVVASMREHRQLSWSIDEDEECLLGGVTCHARLGTSDACRGSSSGGGGGLSYGSARSAALSSPPAPWAVPRAPLPVIMVEHCCWDDACTGCSGARPGGACAGAAPAPRAAPAAPPAPARRLSHAASGGSSSSTSGGADELCEALQGARLSPAVGADLWLSAPTLMESG